MQSEDMTAKMRIIIIYLLCNMMKSSVSRQLTNAKRRYDARRQNENYNHLLTFPIFHLQFLIQISGIVPNLAHGMCTLGQITCITLLRISRKR